MQKRQRSQLAERRHQTDDADYHVMFVAPDANITMDELDAKAENAIVCVMIAAAIVVGVIDHRSSVSQRCDTTHFHMDNAVS